MSAPTSGWYPDPHVPQQMRWWDGAQWTADTYERTEPLPDWTTDRSAAAGGTRTAPAATAAALATDDGAVLASWGRRAAARLLDLAVTGALAWAIGFQQTQVFFRSVSNQVGEAMRAVESGAAAPPFQYDLATLKALAVLSLIWLALSLAYDLAFLLWLAATPGKLALGLQVRRWTPGQRLTVRAIARRWLGFEAASAVSYVGTVYLLVDVLWPLRDRRRQALHDKYAGTCVVRKPPSAG